MILKNLTRFRIIHEIKLDSVLPVVLLPLMFAAAAVNLVCTILVCVAVPLLLSYARYYQRKNAPRSKFFFMWAFWSVFYLFLLFQLTVPLFELLPEENFIFVSAIFASVFCFYQVLRNSFPFSQTSMHVCLFRRVKAGQD